MGLSSDLISQFVKVTNDTKQQKKEVVLYGTIKIFNDKTYVQLDGSDQLTPYESSTEVKEDDRVSVVVKNHTLMATGNMTHPSINAGSGTITDIHDNIDELQANTIKTEDLEAVNGKIENLESNKASIEYLEANYANIEELNAVNATIKQLDAEKVSTEDLEANYANIKFTNIDFANIDKAVFKEFYANSGIIKDVVVNDQQITGTLVGVTITGDLIEGNTIVAEKLVIRGEDGLYYKLNTDGMTIEAEQTEYNSINGSIITAKSITATKIAVEDLVAFGATIGGFTIDDNSIYSGVKASVDNPLPGLYFDNEGQMFLGDNDNYVRYYKDADGNYKLDISAESLLFGVEKQTIENLTAENEALKNQLAKYEKHFIFNENGISILDGNGENTAELRLDTGIISFVKNGEQYGWWDGTDFHTGNIIVEVNERAQFGNFAFVPRSDGSLSFLKVSDEFIQSDDTTETTVIE